MKKMKISREKSVTFEEGCNLYLNNALSDEIRLSQTFPMKAIKVDKPTVNITKKNTPLKWACPIFVLWKYKYPVCV